MIRRNSTSHTDLPARDVTAETIADAYVDFILYCNPKIPIGTDTADLKALFQTPPKSDGKSFSIYILYTLICKLEAKEIKTWAELALELGVELPALDKGQSPQKVQQYAVRLKRWMHAMHVDAFFEYLRGQDHIYWIQVPRADDVQMPDERDGVPREEDLALRALLPETRPKRGRKRAEDKEREQDENTNSRKRRIHSHPGQPSSTKEWSQEAPDDDRVAQEAEARKLLEERLEAWAASAEEPSYASPSMPHRASAPEIKVQINEAPDRRLTHPIYRHPAPESATSTRPLSPTLEGRSENAEPNSRPRRKPGSVVSSAWRSSSATEGAKLRGRPPSNRNMSDGPFTTFPVSQPPSSNLNNDMPGPSPTTVRPQSELWSSAVGNWSAPEAPVGGNGPMSDKFRLPPPVPSLNNLSPYNPMSPSSLQFNTPSPNLNHLSPETTTTGPILNNVHWPSQNHSHPMSRAHPSSTTHRSTTSSSYCADISAPTSTVSPLPQTSHPITYAHRQSIEISPTDPVPPSPDDTTNVAAIELTYIQCIMGAEWVTPSGAPATPPSTDEALRLARQLLITMRKSAEDDMAYLVNVAAMAGGRLLNVKLQLRRMYEDDKEIRYASDWCMQLGPVRASRKLQCAVPKPQLQLDGRGGSGGRKSLSVAEEAVREGVHDPEDPREAGETDIDWKEKYLELRAFTVERGQKLRALKKTVMEGVLMAKDII